MFLMWAPVQPLVKTVKKLEVLTFIGLFICKCILFYICLLCCSVMCVLYCVVLVMFVNVNGVLENVRVVRGRYVLSVIA